MIHTGTLSLRRVCDFFGFQYDPDAAPTDPIGITRADFDEVADLFIGVGMPVVTDLDQAWRDFAGWRVNYDVPLRSLATFIDPPVVPWATDRPLDIEGLRLVRRRR